MIVSVVGFYATGSSAVIDYLKEFKETNVIDLEIHLLENKNGLYELDKIFSLEGGNPVIQGLKINDFQKLVKFLSEKGFGKPYDHREVWNGYFIKRSMQFINDITNGSVEMPIVFNNVENDKKLLNHKRILKFKRFFYKKVLGRKKVKKEQFMVRDRLYFPKVSYEEYVVLQEKYVSDLINYLRKNNKEITILDQFMPLALYKERHKFLKNQKIIYVERDPRDIYISMIERQKEKFVPREVEQFIRFYRRFREVNNIEIDEKDTLFIKFEDLIYNYDKTCEKINLFLGLNSELRINRKKFFNPEISIKNTQLFNDYKKYSKDIEIIKEKLDKYCYEFPKVEIKRDIEIF